MRIIILFVLLIFILSYCSTEPEYMNDGTILSADYRLCGCCGGWFIRIDNDTLRFYTLPSSDKIDLLNEILPLKVKLNWKKDSKACLGDEIIVLQIKKK